MSAGTWRNCSTCKQPIPFGSVYQACSVSSCRKQVFCSVTCWDVHVPVMNHKSAFAEEEQAPKSSDTGDKPRRRIVAAGGSSNATSAREVLIIASKLKAYIKAKADMNCAGNVMEQLSDMVRILTNDAIANARAEGRKTVMDRDFKTKL